MRAYFLRPILKLVMCTVSPLFPSFTQLRQATLALLLAGLALVSGASAQAQTLVGTTNKIAFAKAAEVAMESEETMRITVIRADGMRGKLTADVIVKADTNKIAAGFTGTTVTFNDYQLSSSFLLPISAVVTNTNGVAKITLALTNVVLLPGQNPAYTPVLGTPSTMDISVYDVDATKLISFTKVNNAQPESTTRTNLSTGEITTNLTRILFNVRLGAVLDQADLANISVHYDVQFAPDVTAAQLAPGADFASAADVEREFVSTNGLSGTLTFDSNGFASVAVPTAPDDTVEFDEEFIVKLSNPTGDFADPKSTNSPPDRVKYVLSPQSFSRGRIYFDEPPAGAVDTSFNPDNRPPLRLRHPGANGPVTALASDLVSSNYIVAGNFTAVDAITRHGVARLLPGGTVDPDFTPPANVNGAVTSVDVYQNGPHQGEVVLGGGFSAVGGVARNSVARYLYNGALDLSFDIGIGANGPIYAVKTEGDNSTVIAGDFTSFDGVARNRIARLLPDGSLDRNSFNGRGANGPIYDLAIETPQPFIISEQRNDITNTVTIPTFLNSRAGVVELTYNTLGFSENWQVRWGGNVVFNGRLTTPATPTTLPDGTLGTTNLDQTVIIDLPITANSPNNLTISVTPQPNSETNIVSWKFTALIRPTDTVSVVAVGDFTEFDQTPVNRIVKTDGLGKVDDTFASNIGTGASGTLLAVDIQTDGSYIIGGAFNGFNSQTVGNIARLSFDGVFDETFAAGRGANGAVRDILVDRSDRTDSRRWDNIYIGGDFTEFNGSRRIFLARLTRQGYLDTSFLDSAFNQFAGFPSATGLSPDGTIGAITVGPVPGPVVGGIFDLVGGGATRDSVTPRQNFARLIGGSTGGPGNFTFDEPLFGADEDGDFLTATYSVLNKSIGTGYVAVQTVDQSATAGQDYKAVKAVSTSAGNAVSVQITDDTIIEGDEEFLITTPEIIGKISLAGEPVYPEFAYGPIPNAVGRIVENDVPPAVFSFSKSEYNVDENRGTASIDIFRTGNISDRVTVQFTALLANGSNAASTNDFIPVTGQIVTFASGVTNVTVTVPIRDDQIVEADEVIALAIGGGSSGSMVDTNRSTAVLNIVDNDLPAGKIDFTLAGFTVVEGEVNAVVEAVRTGGNVGFITVDYETVDGTALNGDDYLTRRGTLIWNDRDISTRTILIPIVNDLLVEGSETFTVRLYNGSQPGVIGTRHPTTTVTINDNDFFGNLSFSAPVYFADENGVSAIVQVVRRDGSADTVSVNYATAPGTNAATAAVVTKDYNNVSGTLVFGPGETSKTFIVPILDDSEADGTREVRLTLSAPVKATLGTNSVATLSIVDNETVNVPAGGVDTDFVTSDGANGPVNVVAIHTEGTNNAARKILIAGEFTLFNHLNRQHIAQLNNDGTLDRNFAVNTIINGSIRALSVLPDGKMMIGGHFTTVDGATVNHLARLNAVGHLDTSFQPGAGPDNAVYTIAQTYIGNPTNNAARILIGGDFVTYDSQPRQRIAMVRPDGSVETTFNPGTGPNSSVYTIAVQRDQKILIGGEFVSVGGVPRSFIARLNTDGTLDTTFNPKAGFDGSVHAIVVQPDDKILVGGNFNAFNGVSRPHIARLLLNGDLDPSFDPGSGADAIVTSIALEADGKILVGGDFGTFNGASRRSIVRLLENGSLDLSINFGSGPNGVVSSIAIQSDRGILIGGDFTEVDGYPRERVARLFGGSFAGAGAFEFSSPAYSVRENVRFATLQIRRSGGLEGTIEARYKTTGLTATPGLDYTEVAGDTNTVTFQPGEVFRTISVEIIDDFLPEPNEYLAVSLTDPVGGAIGRQPVTTIEIVSDDTRISFASDAFVVNENSPGSRANITLTREGISSGPITVLFSTSDGTAVSGSDYTPVSIPVTFAPDETVKVVSVPLNDDSTVEGDETVDLSLELLSPSTEASIGIGSATLTIVDNDAAPGTIEFVGTASAREGAGSIILTLSRSGGQLGSVTVNYATENGTAKAPDDYTARTGSVTFQQTDAIKTIVIPISQDTEIEGNESFRVRLSNPTGGATLGPRSIIDAVIIDDDFGPGSLDTTFDVGSGAGTDGVVYAITLQPDGKVLAGGAFNSFDNSGHPNLVRLLPNGSVDDSFSSGTGPAGPVYDIELAEQDRIVIGGDFRSFSSLDRLYYTRLTPSGSLDPSVTANPGLNGFVRTLATQPDHNVVIGGAFTVPANHAGRVLLSGEFDPSFNLGSGADANVLDALVQDDGKVVLAGAFTKFGGLSRGHIVRLNPNGLIDPTFNIGSGANGDINRVIQLPDGRLLVGGDFTTFNGVSAFRLVALNRDGSVSTAFSAGTGPNKAVFALAIDNNGMILVGGDFTSINDKTRNRVARLSATGSVDDTFNPGLGADDTVYDIEIQPDGQILIAGAFDTVNGFPRAGVARLATIPPPEPTFKILSTTLAGTDIQITFESQFGVSYDILATSDLNNQNWTKIRTVPGSGSTTQVSIPLGSGKQFFRVRATGL